MIGGERIAVGYVRRAHGLRGDVIVRALSDDPARFSVGSDFVTDENPERRLVVAAVRSHADGVLLSFEGLGDRNRAEVLQGVTLTIAVSQRRDLEEGEYWPEDLKGLVAVTPDGVHLGTVTGVVLTDAQDRLVVTRPEGGEVEVPFVEAMVGDVHPSQGHVVVDPPLGLF